ncbi:MAG: pyridine nucleotide-disulfide oxidoreductase [Nitrospira bacterium SG8_35_1]|nr:MAG: pyridine nucleotide-disulfide oxidoreductase [Nitrospira bacterium SG8_35_1]
MKYLIIGNGVAGTTAAENIRRLDPNGEITIVTDEDIPFYYRVRLPDYLGGGVAESELVAKKDAWYKEKNISLQLETTITGVDPGEKNVHTADGVVLAYHKLLLANGSHPFIPPVNGSGIKGIFAIHTVNDVRQILKAVEKISSVVLIGGGLLGLETANALHKLGKKITVIEFFPRLLPRQLDNEGATRLQHFFENMGFSFRLGTSTRKITGEEKVEGVLLENGDFVPTEMVIISAGVQSSLELARMLDVKTGKGIIVNKYMQTSQPEIYAAGDVIEFEGKTYGIWPAAMEQGRIAGINISGGKEPYTGTTLSNILKVAGIDLASAGEIDEDNRYESKVVASEDIYKKAVIDNGKVIGCIMLGDRTNFNRINKAISTGENILKDLDTLLNG